MVARQVFHVVPHAKGWATEKEGSTKPLRISETKPAAVEFARSKAKSRRHLGQVIVHGKDGKIQKEMTYGADPVKSKG